MSDVADKWLQDQDPSRRWAMLGAMHAQRYLRSARWVSTKTVERSYKYALVHNVPEDNLRKFVILRYDCDN